MRFYGENGYYPLGTPPQVIEMAEKLRSGARAVANPFGEENNA